MLSSHQGRIHGGGGLSPPPPRRPIYETSSDKASIYDKHLNEKHYLTLESTEIIFWPRLRPGIYWRSSWRSSRQPCRLGSFIGDRMLWFFSRCFVTGCQCTTNIHSVKANSQRPTQLNSTGKKLKIAQFFASREVLNIFGTGWVELSRAHWTLWQLDSTQLNWKCSGLEKNSLASWVELSRVVRVFRALDLGVSSSNSHRGLVVGCLA